MRAHTILLLLLIASPATAADELLPNGGFENGLDGWRSLWTRTEGGRLSLDAEVKQAGRQAARVEHWGSQDWSFHHERSLKVEPGQVFEMSGWVRVEGEGSVTLGVVLRDSQNQTLSWTYGGRTARAADGWQRLHSRFLIPANGANIDPRWMGAGPAKVWLDETSLRLVGSVDQWRAADLPASLRVANDSLEIEFQTADASFRITDRRTGRSWKQTADVRLPVLKANSAADRISFQVLDPASMIRVDGSLQLAEAAAEVVLELNGQGALPGELAYPATFVSQPGDILILPVNEGISYPVDDATLPEMNYYMYGGHGLCMGWWGVTDGQGGLMGLVETPDDASVRIPRTAGLLGIRQCWQPQRGEFGGPRRVRFVCFDQGGYVAMCKRYRQYAHESGNLVTLAEKRAKNPHVDLLVGAVNVWNWDRAAVEMCREMQSLGIGRILWSNRSKPEEIAAMNEMDVLTSRYDIYQDAMNPANFPRLYGRHADWTSDAWPHDLMIDANGDWVRGWGVKARDGEMLPCGVLCDRQAVEYAKRRIPPELETHAYRGRFIDTTTASPWRECYHPDHPMTRSDSRHWKMKLLRYMSDDCGLVTGSETGHEASVPYLHFFEGMMSLGPYRVPDAGRQMAELWDEVPERVAKFQTGHFYRLPLWELVYHDCTVSYWYWGDYNNKLPSLWDRRDLLNALYGTPPMFLFRGKFWDENRDRFIQSYQTAATVARATGYSEMLDHRWLTADHTVQQTRFAGGVVVTVNFGDKPFRLDDGTELAPLSHRVLL